MLKQTSAGPPKRKRSSAAQPNVLCMVRCDQKPCCEGRFRSNHPRGATTCSARYVPHSAQMWCRSFTAPHVGQSIVAAVYTRWSCARRIRLRDFEVRFFGTAMSISQDESGWACTRGRRPDHVPERTRCRPESKREAAPCSTGCVEGCALPSTAGPWKDHGPTRTEGQPS